MEDMRLPFGSRPRAKARRFRATPLFLETLEKREMLDATNPVAHLSIQIDGKDVSIPAQIGYNPDGTHQFLYTDTADGWIHIDPTVASTPHLNDFFAIWGQTFDSSEVLGHAADAAHPLHLFVNNLPSTDFENAVLHDSDQFLISYGVPAPDTGQDFDLRNWIGLDQVPPAAPPVQTSGTGDLPPVLQGTGSPAAAPSAASFFAPLATTAAAQTEPDPAVPGPFATTRQEFTLGNQAFRPTDSAFASGVELTAEITAPTDLTGGPRPVIVLLHGRHVTLYNPATGGIFLAWPPSGSNLTIPSYKGYEYLADNLASHGYVVVSISANGINARDNNTFDLGALARAQLLQRQLDILSDLNKDGVIRTRTGLSYGTDLFTGTSTPFGTRFVGKLDLQNIGTMGHSRGGEGVVRQFALNQSLGSPYGIKAVLPLAPVDFNRPTINGVPLMVILPYDDGDVSDLQGVHFFDDSLYSQPGDRAPKYTVLVNGADHNFFNTIWSPGGFVFGSDDNYYYPADLRLTQAQERGVGLDYMAAFFRAYLGNEAQFLPLLRGDVLPPASALTDQVFVSYEGPDTSTFRRDVNRVQSAANLTTNTLGGAVTTGGLTVYETRGGNNNGETVLPGESFARQPHNTPSARSNKPGLRQLALQWTNTFDAFYQNDLPAGFRDVSGYYALDFRASVNFSSAVDKLNTPQDFTVVLTDGNGNSASTLVSNWARALFYPFGPNNPNTPIPREFLDTIRIPLAAFAGINLRDVRSIRFNFDQRAEGFLLMTDLSFSDPATLYAGPFVVSSTPSQDTVGATSVRVVFNTAIDPNTFTTADVTITDPTGAVVPVTGITPVPGSSNSRFDVSFDPQGRIGTYTLMVGPNVQDTLGHRMDQNFNGVTGENPGDKYVAPFVLHGPRVIATTPSADLRTTTGPFSSIRVTFNEPINPATFTLNQVVLTGPTGAVIPVTGVAVALGSFNTDFDISFAPQTTLVNYSLVVGPNVLDTFGNPMDQDDNFIPGENPGDQFRTTFFTNYTAQFETAQNFEIFGQAGTQAVTFSLGGVTADDDFGVIDLGSNTFNFYGQTYNKLFVGSNGLITFGVNNPSFTDGTPTDMRTFPIFPTIAVYWTDLFKSGTEPMIVWKIVNNQLIIEWYRVTTFDPPFIPMTFQAVLDLNTGGQIGDILLNYQSVTGIGDQPERLGVTVGVKDAGTGNAIFRTLVEDGTTFNPFGDPRVQSGKAVRFHMG
jgi:hypothetical protein